MGAAAAEGIGGAYPRSWGGGTVITIFSPLIPPYLWFKT